MKRSSTANRFEICKVSAHYFSCLSCVFLVFFHHFLCSVLKKKREALVIILLLQAPVKGYWNCHHWYLIQNNTSFCGTLPLTRMTLFKPEQGGLMQNVCMKVSETRCTYWPSLPPFFSSFLPSLYSLPSWCLSGEVGNISMKLSESRLADPHLETQVDLMRHEVRSDMQRLQDLISSSKTSLYSNSLERSFRDMWVFSCLLNWVVFVFVKENACHLYAENN